MTVRIIVGDCREGLRSLPSDSVHCCVTSPPYWGLRDYGIPASIWGGDQACVHRWGDVLRSAGANSVPGPNGQGGKNGYGSRNTTKEAGNFCTECGAWSGAFGLEPDYRMFVANAVDVFREVRRVLRPDGVLWVNLGDSYATGGGAGEQGAGERVGRRHTQESLGGNRGRRQVGDGKNPNAGIPTLGPNRYPQHGLKPKDLAGIPWRVALALQDDGWWLRQDVIWAKPNPMPESVTDRCTKSHEYFFMLTKSERYHWDAEAIAEPLTEVSVRRLAQNTDEQHGSERAMQGGGKRTMKAVKKKSGNLQRKAASERGVPDRGFVSNQAGSVPWEGDSRNKRSVWTVGTQGFDGEFCRACRTFFTGDALLALRVAVAANPDGAKKKTRHCSCGSTDRWLSHFATFPPALIEPCVGSSSSEAGCCAECGAPRVRVSEPTPEYARALGKGYHGHADDGGKGMMQTRGTNRQNALRDDHGISGKQMVTTGWRQTCSCAGGGVAPCTVLDPFGGAGTTGLVADRMHRDAILIEVNADYAEMARQRIHADGGMLARVALQAVALPEEAAE